MLARYFHTLRFLRFTQVFYQLYYKLRRVFRKFSKHKLRFNTYKKGSALNFNERMPKAYKSYSFAGHEHHFSFLNLKTSFQNIDWDYAAHGKLWTYNLNYFDFLNQEAITKEEGLLLIHDFIPHLPQLKNANEPYPISLRGINWIKFLSKYNISDTTIDNSLYSQYLILLDNLEYHLLGNHLLENGFSLYIGGCYFKDEKLINKGFQIIANELKEQILEDGGHFELSAMYHQILFSRLLDCISIGKENHLALLKDYAIKMSAWLQAISFANGEIPLVNDAAKNIAPTTKELIAFAEKLGVVASKGKLNDSGYRKFEIGNLELLVDAGKIGPSYIPGHAHADIFNFVLYDNGAPILVDTGISTYEKNKRRQDERSTFSHNTVEVNDKNQIDVWGGFRVGKRATIKIENESAREITASHNGYSQEGVIHQRIWKITKEGFEIADTLKGKNVSAKAYLHFHPSCKVKIEANLIKVNHCSIQITNSKKLYLQPFVYAEEYNKFTESIVAVVEFEGSLLTSFTKTIE
jgi:hypothetical protein